MTLGKAVLVLIAMSTHNKLRLGSRRQKTKDRLRNKCKDNTVLIAIGAYYKLYLDSGQQKTTMGLLQNKGKAAEVLIALSTYNQGQTDPGSGQTRNNVSDCFLCKRPAQ